MGARFGLAARPRRAPRGYERAAALLDRPRPAAYDAPAARPDDGVRFDDGDLRTLVFHEDAEPLRFGRLLRARLRPGDGVDVVTLANVTEVRLDDLGARVDGVEAATVNGRRFVVRAPVVVLGCGAIENARLLLASRARRPAGLGNAHDVVGRYFQDHPKGFTGLLAVDPAAPRLPASGYWPARATAHGRTRWGIGLTEAAQRREEVLNSYVRLEPTVLDQVPAGIAALKRAARGRVRGLDPHDLSGLVADAPALARLARFRLRNEGPIDLVRVRSFLEQEPRWSSRVRLSDRRDPLGRPLAAVDWDLSDLDRRSVRVLHEALARACHRHGLGELQVDLDDASPAWADLADASHHAGTTRMGTDPRTSVTDPHGEVHDVPGLFVVGASLFPTSGYANPVFTIAATALHVADAVAARMSAGPVDLRAPAHGRVTPAAEPEAVERPAPTAAGTAEAKRWLAARRRSRKVRPAASTGTAIVWTGPGRAEVVPVEVPAPRQGQVSVLVEVSAVSLGTERARWLGLPGASVRYPHQPGYSLAGTVHAVGPGVYDIEPGTPVAVWGAPHQSLVTVDRVQVHPLAEGADLDVGRPGDPGGHRRAGRGPRGRRGRTVAGRHRRGRHRAAGPAHRHRRRRQAVHRRGRVHGEGRGGGGRPAAPSPPARPPSTRSRPTWSSRPPAPRPGSTSPCAPPPREEPWSCSAPPGPRRSRSRSTSSPPGRCGSSAPTPVSSTPPGARRGSTADRRRSASSTRWRPERCASTTW